jgi:hypothetical protein
MMADEPFSNKMFHDVFGILGELNVARKRRIYQLKPLACKKWPYAHSYGTSCYKEGACACHTLHCHAIWYQLSTRDFSAAKTTEEPS